MDDTDPMVSVMKLEKAPKETYADIGGLDQQIQEIKVLLVICVTVCILVTVCNTCTYHQERGHTKNITFNLKRLL